MRAFTICAFHVSCLICAFLGAVVFCTFGAHFACGAASFAHVAPDLAVVALYCGVYIHDYFMSGIVYYYVVWYVFRLAEKVYLDSSGGCSLSTDILIDSHYPFVWQFQFIESLCDVFFTN